MNVQVERLDSKKVKMEVTVEAAKFQAAVLKSFKKNASSFNVQGFRKGKAPLNLVKKMYGAEVLYDDAANFVLNDSYPEALTESGVKPVDYPKIDITQMEEGKEFIYTAEVEVYPEFDLPEYKGLSVVKPVHEVKEEDVEKEIDALKEKHVRMEAKDEEGTVAEGDIATIDFVGKVDGEAFEGGSGEDFELTIGAKMFIDNFEDQLIGMKAGEEKVVNVNFPAEYGSEALAGKNADFEVKVKSIQAKEYPVVDDEFASEVSEFETLEELKASIRTRMEKEGADRADNELRNNLLKALAEKATIDIPEAMVEEQIDRLVRDFEQRLKMQGIEKDMYLQMTGQEEGGLRDMFRDNARTVVKNDLLVNAIMDKENLEATEDEMKAKAEAIAEVYGDQKDQLLEMLLNSNRTDLAMEIKSDKVFDLLKAHAVFVEKAEAGE